MYLKRVEIQGFKSFADSVEIEFQNGITCIVGPNGSGKSNISDAVRWVLGEQSAKTLRGSKMEDIIFAGTTQRKPIGMAEVSLTLDNQSNKLGVDYSEVTITRRVYRSGESEYYINQSLCRLKDIKEIFMDTGVGIDGYSIIGQGRIDEILNNKSGNRRLLFEEAAGIVKYKVRKEEAEKKLENTNQNLMRVNDIIVELKSRIEPLKLQSEKARMFLEMRDELKELEVNLLVHELENFRNDIETLKEQQSIIGNQLDQYLDEKKGIEERYRSFMTEIETLDKSIHQLQNNIFETVHLIEKKEGELSLCKEKITNNTKEIERLNKEILQTDENQNTLSRQSYEMITDLEQENKAFQSIQSLLDHKVQDLNSVTRLLTAQEKALERSKENIIDILNAAATKKSEIQSFTALENNILKRQKQIEIEKKNLESKKACLLQEEQDAQQICIRKEAHIEKLKKTKDLLGMDIQQLSHAMQQAKEENESLKQKIHEKQTRKKLLKEMEKDYEGFHKSVKNTLIHAKENPRIGQGIFGVVAELITVSKGFEIAVEVSLGSAMQNIVCATTEDANRVIQYLKQNKLGRVTFLPIDRFKGNHVAYQKNKFGDIKGCLGFAIEHIQFSEQYANILEYLLGRVLFVDEIENGILLSQKTDNRYKIVSLDGDIINPSGAITGGSYRSKTLNILNRKREIEELERDIDTLNSYYQEQVKKVLAYEKELDKLREAHETKDTLLKEKEIQLINDRNHSYQIKKEIETYEKDIHRIDLEIEQLEIDRKETQITILQKQEALEKLTIDEKEIQDTVKINKNSYEEQKAYKEEMSTEVTSLRVKIATLSEKRQHIEKKIKEIQASQKELESLKCCKLKEIDELINSKEFLHEKLKELKIALKDADVLKKQCEFNLSQLKLNKNEVQQSFREAEMQLAKINEIIAELQDSNHKIEVKLTRLEIQQESYCNKLWDEYEITYMEALAYKNENINLGESSKQIKKLKNKIKDLESVNIEAIKEYEEVIERHGFLSMQKHDLMGAIASLNEVIKEMESTMKAQFMDYFEKIKENFNQVFQALFGGGRAELKLEDEHEILTTGIEIVAQPPGKKLQSLSLLSGGERALTAIALLFAILKVKPTPFCILDEIEAALDDANVYRYAEFLRKFSKETQFIVVTHRKGTMECADALYGVTMQEHGISKLVSVKLTEDEKAS
ncbi:chromosome segregation protein SMC [Clostridiaceae bacterium 35-E11]